ncbi:MAG: hypothetical protein R3D67_21120 [Hyphomicrobiaceae bacterium]
MDLLFELAALIIAVTFVDDYLPAVYEDATGQKAPVILADNRDELALKCASRKRAPPKNCGVAWSTRPTPTSNPPPPQRFVGLARTTASPVTAAATDRPNAGLRPGL